MREGIGMEQNAGRKARREDATVTEFGSHLEPMLRVKPGERFLIETQDNFFGEIKTEEDLPTPERFSFLPPSNVEG